MHFLRKRFHDLFSKYVLWTYYAPSPVQDLGDRNGNKMQEDLNIWGRTQKYIESTTKENV